MLNYIAKEFCNQTDLGIKIYVSAVNWLTEQVKEMLHMDGYLVSDSTQHKSRGS